MHPLFCLIKLNIMKRDVIFEGKIQVAGNWVDLRIYKVYEEESPSEFSYEWQINPILIDMSQMDPHRGGINLGHDLEDILFHIKMYQDEIREVKRMEQNPLF